MDPWRANCLSHLLIQGLSPVNSVRHERAEDDAASPLAPRDSGKRLIARIKQEKHRVSGKTAEVSRRFQTQWACSGRARGSEREVRPLLWLCHEPS
jgi:hypothetical protein